MRWCARCENCRWVCENHPDRPWEGERACGCGGAGMPCPVCNSSEVTLPEMPDSFVKDLSVASGEFARETSNRPAKYAEHFVKCPACGAWIDCRDLGAVLDHAGPLPHPAIDRPQ